MRDTGTETLVLFDKPREVAQRTEDGRGKVPDIIPRGVGEVHHKRTLSRRVHRRLHRGSNGPVKATYGRRRPTRRR